MAIDRLSLALVHRPAENVAHDFTLKKPGFFEEAGLLAAGLRATDRHSFHTSTGYPPHEGLSSLLRRAVSRRDYAHRPVGRRPREEDREQGKAGLHRSGQG